MSVQSIERAFVLLRTIAQYPDGITVTDLARRTGLHKSTVSRFITALEHENAIARVDNALFIGTGIADLLTDSLHTSTIAALARPYLELLAADFNETVGIGVPEGDCVHYIDQVTANQASGFPITQHHRERSSWRLHPRTTWRGISRSRWSHLPRARWWSPTRYAPSW
jgi:DNA-binding IclR family transcriptional regulator